MMKEAGSQPSTPSVVHSPAPRSSPMSHVPFASTHERAALRGRGRGAAPGATRGLGRGSFRGGRGMMPLSSSFLNVGGGSGTPCGGGVIDLRSLDLRTPDGRGSRSPLVSPRQKGTSTHGKQPPSKILDFLYLGSVEDAQDASFLARSHIRCIINISAEEYWSADKNVIVYPFRVDDTSSADISLHFRPTIGIIERVRRLHYAAREKGLAAMPRVLVHCQKGRSRSPTIVIAYLLLRHGWSLEEALQYVSRRRANVEPNLGFMAALQRLEGSISRSERKKLLSQQSVVVKYLSRSTSATTVRDFFEKYVGLVREVVMQDGSVSATAESRDDSAADAVSQEPTLCMVFFASFENVKLALEFVATHPAETAELVPVPQRVIRLVVPSRMKANPGVGAGVAGPSLPAPRVEVQRSLSSATVRRSSTNSGADAQQLEDPQQKTNPLA